MASERRILFAAPPKTPPAGPYSSLFGDESVEHSGFVSKERTYELAGKYSRLYRESVDAVAPALARELGIPAPAAAAFSREALVPLLHFHLDRLMRLELALAEHPGADWAVAKAPAGSFPVRIDAFRHATSTSALVNHLLVERLALLRGLPLVDAGLVPDVKPAGGRFVNRNFDPSTKWEKIRRIALIGWRKLGALRGPIPVLSMGYSTDPFKNAGFYGSRFASVQGRVNFEDGPAAPAVRSALRAALKAAEGPFASFLVEAKTTALPAKSVFESFVGLAVEVWPASLLESGKTNLARAEAVLAAFAPRPLLVCERGDLESLVFIAAARCLGMPVVGFQHGGHSGYMADIPATLELDQWHCDKYISWGWDRFPAYPPPPPGAVPVPLPNPFLSERARRWRAGRKPAAGKPYDFLLFSNGVHHFAPSPGGAVQATTDYLEQFRKMLVTLVSEANERGRTILHKPRDPAAAVFFSKTYAEMIRVGGKGYAVRDRADKGLTQELLDLCRVVLWDQLGMGFLECIAAGVPTMCYSSLPMIIEPAAAGHIAELKKSGILHTTAASLFHELEVAKSAGIEKWASEPPRAAACEKFSRAYGWASPDWAAVWSSQLTRMI